jgi:hypothetical protein
MSSRWGKVQFITKQLETIAVDIDMGVAAAAKITFILKENLSLPAVKSPKEKEKLELGKNPLTDLFKSFEHKNPFTESKTDVTPSPELDSSDQSFEGQNVLPPVKVKLLGFPGKAGGLPIVFNRRTEGRHEQV